MGQDRSDHRAITLQSWARFVADLSRQQSENVILVGHSRGGAVISQAAEYMPECVSALVYVSGMLLPAGASVLSFGSEIGNSAQLAAAIRPTGDGASFVAPREQAPFLFYNTAAPEWAQHAASKLGPEPIAPNADRLCVTDAAFGRAPRYYVECAQDRVIALAAQRLMHTRIHCRVVHLDSDHSPFYSAPEALAAALLSIAG